MGESAPPTLAMVQMRVVGGEPDINIRRAGELIAEAAGNGADLVLLPELFDLGWAHPSARKLAGEIPGGATCCALRGWARRHGVWVGAGLAEREGERLFNAAVLIDREGEVVLRHRKINELEFAAELYARGEETEVVETEFGTVGLMICADAFVEGHPISRALGKRGARLILSPCAWAVPADHDDGADPYGALWTDCYRPVAEEYSLWIAGVSNVGVLNGGGWAGRHCIGSSMLVNPSGEVEKRAPFGVDAEAILYAEVALSDPPQSDRK